MIDRVLATHRRQNWKKSPIFLDFGGEWEEGWEIGLLIEIPCSIGLEWGF